jgi:hypothetical protein
MQETPTVTAAVVSTATTGQRLAVIIMQRSMIKSQTDTVWMKDTIKVIIATADKCTLSWRLRGGVDCRA